MKVDIKVEGLKELERNLSEIDTLSSRRSVGRRVLRKAGQPLADALNRNAPDDPSTPGGLSTSHVVSTRLNKRQARMARKEGKSDVEVYVGTNDPAGIQIEYGNVNHPAQPYARNTWDSMKRSILGSIKEYLSEEIIKTIARQTKKRMGR